MISILCPSRGRPDKFREMVQSAQDTADGEFEIWAYLDSDTDDFKTYPFDVPANYSVGPRLPLSPAYQKLLSRARGDIVMMCADDIVFKTKGWDSRVKSAMPKDLIGVVSCNEGNKGRKEHGHPFIGRRFIEEMGYICHPKLNHSCVDMWVREVAEDIKRFFYLDDVFTEHRHPKYGKGVIDQTYTDNNKQIQSQDGDFYRSSKNERNKAVERLSKCLSGS